MLSSSTNSGGIIRVIGCPIISSALKPNKCVAAAFQLVTVPSSVLLMIASDESSTIADSLARIACVASAVSAHDLVRSSISVTLTIKAELVTNTANPSHSVTFVGGSKTT